MLSTRQNERLKKHYGPWAIVTGATSGIGLELAQLLAAAGLHLIICGRDTTRLAHAQQQLSRHGITVRAITADLSGTDGVAQVIAAAESLDVGLLINNAGYGTSGLLIDNALDAEVDMLRVNCEAVLRLTHHFGARLRKRGSGGIIFLSSLVAWQGVPYAAHYAATKAYVQSLAEGLAVELRPYGVDVLSAAPGPVESGFGQRADMRMGSAEQPAAVAPAILAALGRSSHVTPGTLSKVLTYALSTAPRSLRVRIMQQIMGSFTQHQRQ